VKSCLKSLLLFAPVAIVPLVVPAALAAQEGQSASVYRLTLGDAARLAAERGAPVLEAQARTEAAEARVSESTSDLLPSVEANMYAGARTFNTASFGIEFPSIPGGPTFAPGGSVIGPVRMADFRARADIPLVDFAALRRRHTAQANANAVRSAEGTAEDAAAATATRVYVATLRAHAEVDARKEDLRLAEELLYVARGLVESGVGVAIDVTRAEAQVATIRAQLLAAEHRERAAELALRRSLRLPEDAVLELADDLASPPATEPPTEGEAIAVALGQRSDLGSAEANETAARASISATRAGWLPRLSLSLDDGFYGSRFDNLLNTYAWTFRLSVPLFDGAERSARAREQRAQARELGYRIESLREDIVFQVRQAMLDLDAAREQAAAADERERLAQLEVDQEEERVRAGVAGTADVVRAAQRLNEARTARLDALASVHTARIEVAAATGTLSELP